MNPKLIIFIIMFCIFASCNNENQSVTTIVSDILPDSRNETITLVPVHGSFPELDFPNSYLTTNTDCLGKYSFRFSTDNADFYQIVFGNLFCLNADIFVESGDSRYI